MAQEIATVGPEAHSDIVGGSSAAMRIGCPGSYRMQQRLKRMREQERIDRLVASVSTIVGRSEIDPVDLVEAARQFAAPIEETSSYAEEGTALHEAIAWILLHDKEAHDVVGMRFNESGPLGGTLMSYDLVNECLVPALKALDDYLDRIEAEDGGPAEMLIEKRAAMPGIPGAFGTCDLIIRTPKRSCVWDWKFGGGVKVVVERNKQLMFYGRAGASTFPAMFEKRGDWPVDLVICQPRLDIEPAVWSTDMKALEAFRLELVGAVTEAVESDNPKVETGSWCRFADCKVVCPLHAGAAATFARKLAVVQAKSTGEVLDIVDAEFEEVETGPNTLPELYALLLDMADIIEPLAGEARKQAKLLVEQGHDVPGWMLAEKKSSGREWVDEAAGVKWCIAQGLEMDEILEPPTVRTAPAIEKVMKAQGILKSKDKLPDTVARPKPSSGSNLVRRDGKHEELIPTAATLNALAMRLLAR